MNRVQTFWRGDVMAAFASLLALLIVSQGWILPFFGEADLESSSGILRGIFLIPEILGVVILAGAPQDFLRGLIKAWPLGLLLGFALLSVNWSVDPETTQRRLIALTLTMTLGYALAARWSAEALVEVFASVKVILVLGAYLCALAFPSIGKMTALFPGAWRGLWIEKNGLGEEMTFGVITFLAAMALAPQRRRLWGAFAALSLGLVLLSQSKTSLLALILSVSVFCWVVFVRRGMFEAVLGSGLAVLGAAVAVGGVTFARDELLALVGKDATFTGRTKIWDGIDYVAKARPWFGYGYGATWDNVDAWGPLAKVIQIARFRPRHAHSAWMEMRLSLGWTGFGIWCLVFAQAWLSALYAAFCRPIAFYAMPFLVAYSLMGVSESVALNINDERWVVFCAILVKLAAPDQAAAWASSSPAATSPNGLMSKPNLFAE